jgi:type IV pilus assembly protein PilC
MEFAYEAMNHDGRVVSDCLTATSPAEAAETLRGKGMVVLRLNERGLARRRVPVLNRSLTGSRVNGRDLILFTRQMKMLLESGSPLVPALEAIEKQATKAAFRTVMQQVREAVEKGASLTEALQASPNVFNQVFCTMVAAGESTAALPQAFNRLSELAQRQQQTRKLVIGAMMYPMILSILLVSAIGVLLGFVVPRFRDLFTNLRSKLPASTEIMFKISDGLRSGWPFVLGGLVLVGVAVPILLRLPQARREVDRFLLRLPVVGQFVRRLLLARVLRVWSATLGCHVPLLDAIRQSRDVVRNVVLQGLIGAVEESVSSGGRVGRALGDSNLVSPVVVSAITTGEENGRLAESVDFVSRWMDEDNAQAIQHLTRLVEPLMLAVMGLVVGLVAMSLFVPLFDLATAAG